MSLIKKKLQQLYDDQLFIGNVIAEQVIMGKRYKFIEPFDRQDQRQWQELNREESKDAG